MAKSRLIAWLVDALVKRDPRLMLLIQSLLLLNELFLLFSKHLLLLFEHDLRVALIGISIAVGRVIENALASALAVVRLGIERHVLRLLFADVLLLVATAARAVGRGQSRRRRGRRGRDGRIVIDVGASMSVASASSRIGQRRNHRHGHRLGSSSM